MPSRITKRGSVAGRLGAGVGVATLGIAGLAIALEGAAAAAKPAPAPTPTDYFTVTPPTLGETPSPDPVTGTTGVQTTIEIYISSQNDFAPNPAPTGTVAFADSDGVITNCTKVTLVYENLDLSHASCTVTFPATIAASDVVTVTYEGDKYNGALTAKETIDFPPPAQTPEAPLAIMLPLTAAAIGGGAVVRTRRRSRTRFVR